MITSIVFVVVGFALIISLFKGILQILTHGLGEEGLTANSIMRIFKITILSFIFLFIYVLWIMPYLEANGLD